MIKMVVFDMAGTVVNEDNVVYKTLQCVINKYGFNFSLEEVLRVGAGMEKLNAINAILQLDATFEKQVDTALIFEDFKEQLALAYNTLALLPQPGAAELFIELRKQKYNNSFKYRLRCCYSSNNTKKTKLENW